MSLLKRFFGKIFFKKIKKVFAEDFTEGLKYDILIYENKEDI